jgi:hypothetical protein
MASVKIQGLKQVLRDISDDVKGYNQAVDLGVLVTANEIRRHSVLSIDDQSNGEPRNASKRDNHIISKEGQAPNTDLGGLVGSIKVSHITGSDEAIVFSNLDYAAYLEFILDRPWLEPAMIAKSDQLKPNIESQMLKIRGLK